MQEGRKCPVSLDEGGNEVENLALDEELNDQVEIVKIALSINEATMDAQVLKKPFEEMGLYDDILSYAQIISTWNTYKLAQKPKS
jgi:hypothetical protein